MGSAYGVYRLTGNPMNGNITVRKHPESNKRYYTDPDREYLYDKQSDGTLELKEKFKDAS